MKSSIRAPFLILLLLAGTLPSAVKIRYGGDLRLRLNEPDTLRMSASSHSNLLLYSLLYENFFYSVPGRETKSHLFKRCSLDNGGLKLTLELHEGLAFSNGKRVLSRHVKNSLTSFFNRVLYRSRRIAGRVKTLVVKGDSILEITFNSAEEDVIEELSAPELVLIGDEESAFSGPYAPSGWDKGKSMVLTANPYYAGGRHPIDRVTILFQDESDMDIFLAEPGFSSPEYRVFPSGLYENTYITFPASGNTGQNKRMAFFSLCSTLNGLTGYTRLESLTSPEESPLRISIRQMGDRKVLPILRSSRQTVYLAASLSVLEPALADRFRRLAVPVEIRVLSDNDLSGYIQKNPVPVLIVKKLFRSETALTEKLASLVREFSFNRFDEGSLGLIKQLEELAGVSREELVVPALSGITEKIVQDGIILPLYQQRFQLMVRQGLDPVVIDQYSRIAWSELRHEPREKNR